VWAAQNPQNGYDELVAARKTSGRREDHAVLDALGWLGDPHAIPILVGCLKAMDVDPGRGFAQRRTAALSLGHIGDSSATTELLAALDRERTDFEGRPGAGLGVQFPVRSAILWALGELGDARAIPALIAHLGQISGPAAGFHIPAMVAMVKIGPCCAPALGAALDEGEIIAANAAGTLAALGPSPAYTKALQDQRPRVRDAINASQWALRTPKPTGDNQDV